MAVLVFTENVFSLNSHNFAEQAFVVHMGWITCSYRVDTGFVRVLEILESPGNSLWHFPELESPGKRLQVLESPGNLSNSRKKVFHETTIV